jgi:hypothetical protein
LLTYAEGARYIVPCSGHYDAIRIELGSSEAQKRNRPAIRALLLQRIHGFGAARIIAGSSRGDST